MGLSVYITHYNGPFRLLMLLSIHFSGPLTLGLGFANVESGLFKSKCLAQLRNLQSLILSWRNSSDVQS